MIVGRALMLSALCLLAACNGGAGWEKIGADAEDMRADRAACLRYARAVAEEEVYAGTAPVTRRVVPGGGVIGEQAGAERTARLAESARRVEVFEECMRKLGYRHQP
jgi:hypothetical protein